MNPSGVMLTITGDPKNAKNFLKVRRQKISPRFSVGFTSAVLSLMMLSKHSGFYFSLPYCEGSKRVPEGGSGSIPAAHVGSTGIDDAAIRGRDAPRGGRGGG